MSSFEDEIKRLNKELSEITTDRIRIVISKEYEEGIICIVDIVELPKKWICTKKLGLLSAEGKRDIQNRMPEGIEDWSLITLENASE